MTLLNWNDLRCGNALSSQLRFSFQCKSRVKFGCNLTVLIFPILQLSLIKRHKLVYACVHDEIASGELHALTIIAKTSAEMA